ncbi:DEAD/DEAH box helicase family protein [Isachenkonia alkalipeptolytica]|uniref:Restriction endonuclease subunit R n=1 Tax=Isachenkonia alkalipeptolytica TaxID=2565777 RepID=A0AA43XKQ7_9CLOT|nr:DEAD/DEAH box helicase family protein [Isachenkonia alkalipeptolytica]NBG88116.1 restriction endonuclease subunit R [Isachenkonia alkalipeptolytica]
MSTYSENAITGRSNDLYTQLKLDLFHATEIKFLVSFVMESGVKLLIKDLKKKALEGVNIKILTGTYLGITEPQALYLLKKELGNQVDIRIFNDTSISFHPKAYFLKWDKEGVIFVGSSNMSRSALTNGLEWNYRLQKEKNNEDFQSFEENFDELYQNDSIPLTDEFLRKYASNWKKTIFSEKGHLSEIKVEEQNDKIAEEGEGYGVLVNENLPEPRGAQIEALYELGLAREEGIDRGLVVAATGVGKTYLAAFDTMDFKRVLFIAHRKEILNQTEITFRSLRPEISVGYFNQSEKETEKDLVLGSVQTLGKDEYLNEKYFKKDTFDYIVVDEFHHAAANSYRKIIEYFQPEFLLGLTATPYRMDNQDIFQYCDDNIIYEVDVKSAIDRDLLVPFKYYGVYDDTDYDNIERVGGKYKTEDLEKALSKGRRADLVLKHYQTLGKKRTIGFCSSINHAEFMAGYFNERGIPSAAVHSRGSEEDFVMDRDDALKALERGEIRVVFAVDVFNEGVDVPSLDCVMFLRPTESYTVFLQQLGRGLRKFQGKEYLTVLDFIGNFKSAHYIPLLLAGKNPMEAVNERKKSYITPEDLEYPEGCNVQFDFRLIDLFQEMKKRDPLRIRMKDEYYRLKAELGRRPKRMDLMEGTDLNHKHYLKKSYLDFLQEINELSAEEEAFLRTEAEKFLRELEKTSMSKSYKIPTIEPFTQKDEMRRQVSIEEVAESFMKFYKNHKLHQKDLNNKNHKNWETWDIEDFKKLAVKNPVHFLSKSSFFSYDEVNKVFSLKKELEPFLNETLKSHMKDILKLRKHEYFARRFKEED